MAGHSGGIPENIIEEIIARNDIASVVGQYVRFSKTSGQNLFGLCPFHSEDTPSFSISTSKQIYYCFGCHKGGNVIHFMMEIEKCGYLDAIKMLAERAQIRIPEPEDESYRKEAQLRDKVRESLVEAARYFYQNLMSPRGKTAREYLSNRKISGATAKAFGLGYSPDDWGGLYRHLKAKGFTDDILAQCGLFTKGKKGELLDLFRGRLMFPIFDVLGKVIAFGGRILGDGNPKYINSPETVIYSKQRNLYALNFAKMSKEKKMIIVEGYMDVISMHQAGVINTVASLGTALTERQLDLISRYTEEVVLFYDSDAAGQAAILRGLQMLLQRGKRHSTTPTKISVAMVPDGKDPDEYIREHGAEAFRRIVADALSVMEYLMLVAGKQSMVSGRLDARTYQNLACKYLSWEPNEVLRERSAGEAAQILGVSVKSVLSETERVSTETTEQEKKESTRQLERQVSVLPQRNEGESARNDEVVLLCLLAGLGSSYHQLEDKPIPTDFSAGTMRDIASEAIKLLDSSKLDAISLLNLGEDRIINQRPAREVLSELLMRTQNVSDEKKRIWHVLRSIYTLRIAVYAAKKDELAKLLDKMPQGIDREATVKNFQQIADYIRYIRERKEQLDDD